MPADEIKKDESCRSVDEKQNPSTEKTLVRSLLAMPQEHGTMRRRPQAPPVAFRYESEMPMVGVGTAPFYESGEETAPSTAFKDEPGTSIASPSPRNRQAVFMEEKNSEDIKKPGQMGPQKRKETVLSQTPQNEKQAQEAGLLNTPATAARNQEKPRKKNQLMQGGDAGQKVPAMKLRQVEKDVPTTSHGSSWQNDQRASLLAKKQFFPLQQKKNEKADSQEKRSFKRPLSASLEFHEKAKNKLTPPAASGQGEITPQSQTAEPPVLPVGEAGDQIRHLAKKTNPGFKGKNSPDTLTMAAQGHGKQDILHHRQEATELKKSPFVSNLDNESILPASRPFMAPPEKFREQKSTDSAMTEKTKELGWSFHQLPTKKTKGSKSDNNQLKGVEQKKDKRASKQIFIIESKSGHPGKERKDAAFWERSYLGRCRWNMIR